MLLGGERVVKALHEQMSPFVLLPLSSSACGFEARPPLASGKPSPLAACPFLPQKSSLWRRRAATGREAWGSRTPTEPATSLCVGGRVGTEARAVHVQETGRAAPRMINRHLLSPKLHVLSACCFHCQKTFGAICLEVGLLNLIGSDGTPLGWWKGIWWKEAGGEEKSGRRSKLSTFPAVSQYGPSCAHSKPPQASPCSLHTAHW